MTATIQMPQPELAPLASLNPAPYNPRRISPEELSKLKRSIREFGFVEPLVARRKDGLLIGGHQRLRALLSIHEEDHVPTDDLKVLVVWLDNISDAKAKALNLALNKIRGQWDTIRLAELLADLGADDSVDVTLTGFVERERALLAQVLHDEKVRLARSGVVVAGEDPEIGELPDDDDGCDSEPGKVYQLGPHRLACGDSTDRSAWDALLGEDRLAMVWTDPPYGVAYQGRMKARAPIKNDALTAEQLGRLLGSCFRLAVERCSDGATWYVAGAGRPAIVACSTVLTELDLWRQMLTWVKDTFVVGRSDYQPRHEHIFYGWTPGRHYFVPDRTISSVLEYPRPRRSDLHPTMKPVELVRFCIANSSRPGAIVADPFGGSGTTLIAAAYEGRVARLIELDRRYCDAIRRRWTAFAESAGLEPGSGALR